MLIQIDRPPDVSIVIPTYGHVRLTALCLASIARTTTGLTYELIIVDNGSKDETLSFVGSHSPGQLRGAAQGGNPPVKVTLLHNPKPRCLSKSWNMGVDAAVGRHVLVCNNDIVFTDGAIGLLIKAADSDPHAGIVIPMGPHDVKDAPRCSSPELSDHPVAESLKTLSRVEAYGRSRPIGGYIQYVTDPYIPQGAFCFLLTRRAFKRVGRFDEEYELTGEDWDYLSRLRRHYKLLRVHDAYVEHFEHQTCKELGNEWWERLCKFRFMLTEKREGCMEIFSIVMPVYNRIDSLREAIDSVLAQSFIHWRLYVVDDGSDIWNQVMTLAKSYELESGRIWFFHRPKNEGPGPARNYGLSQSNGKYVAFLDSDDVWYPDHLAKHFAAHEESGSAMVYSNPSFATRRWDKAIGRFIYTQGKHPTIDYFGDYDKERLVRHNYIQTSSVSVWGELGRSLSFPELRMGEDWEYFKAVADAGGKGRPVKHINSETCRYHLTAAPHESDHLMRSVLPNAGTPGNTVASLILSGVKYETEKCAVVIATRDRATLLTRSLDSVGANRPVVVVDDGSRSAAPAIYDLVKARPGATLLRNDVSTGASVARNYGVDHALYDWIQFLDDDDILVPGWIDIIRPYMTTSVDAIVGAAYVPQYGGLTVSTEVFTSQICVRRSSFHRAGGFKESLTWAEERDLLDRMQKMGMNIVRLSLPVCTRPSRGGSGDPSTATGAPVRRLGDAVAAHNRLRR